MNHLPSSAPAGPVVPEYGGASVERILPALLLGEEAPWMPEPARAAETIVVLVIDGLGRAALDEHSAAMPRLAAMTGGTVTTVVPSTTAAALTSMTTGLVPTVHGVTGYRVLIGGSVLNVLRWQVADKSRPPDPFDVQRHTAFCGREVPVVTKSEFRKTGFTEVHLRGGRFVGWQTTATLVEHCRVLAEARERVVWAYYGGLDTVAHEFGLQSAFYRREMRAVDDLVAQLIDALPSSAALLVTSDHGQVHLERGDWLELTELAPLVTTMAGDGRFRYLYARRGAGAELLAAARQTLGSRAWVLSRGEVLEAGWLGAGADGSVPGRIGDVVLAAREPVAFVDPALPKEVRLRSGHGSLTAHEMLVPLVAATGSGRG